MYTEVKSSHGIALVPLETSLLSKRRIFIEGEINSKQAFGFIKQLMVLIAEDSQKEIDILINSPGGEINSGLLMYDILQSCVTPVRMFCLGRAYSMAAVLFASGMNGRYMLSNSELMLHEPLLGEKVAGSSSTIHSISESLLETKSKLNRILVKHTGNTAEEIEKATSFDHYFSAKDSIAFGLCDEIVGLDKVFAGGFGT